MLRIRAKHNKTNYAQRPQHRKPFANHWSTCGVPTSHFGNLITVPFVTIIKSQMTKSIEMLTNLEIWEPLWMLNMRTKTQSQLCLLLVQLDLYGHQLAEYYHLWDTTNDNQHMNKVLCPVFENNVCNVENKDFLLFFFFSQKYAWEMGNTLRDMNRCTAWCLFGMHVPDYHICSLFERESLDFPLHCPWIHTKNRKFNESRHYSRSFDLFRLNNRTHLFGVHDFASYFVPHAISIA